MSGRIIQVNSGLWLDINDTELKFDGLFYIRDDTGGNALIDVEDIPALIEALRKVVVKKETT